MDFPGRRCKQLHRVSHQGVQALLQLEERLDSVAHLVRQLREEVHLTRVVEWFGRGPRLVLERSTP